MSPAERRVWRCRSAPADHDDGVLVKDCFRILCFIAPAGLSSWIAQRWSRSSTYSQPAAYKRAGALESFVSIMDGRSASQATIARAHAC